MEKEENDNAVKERERGIFTTVYLFWVRVLNWIVEIRLLEEILCENL